MVAVDTSVWSLFLRRRRGRESAALQAFKAHLAADDVVLLGIVHQELLSGIKDRQQFDRIDSALGGFDEIVATVEDHRRAARFFNLCRKHGVQGSGIDFLICAMAARRKLPILTTDRDFSRYATRLPISLVEF